MVFGIFGIPNIDVGISVFFQISRICFVFWHTDPWWYSVVCLDLKILFGVTITTSSWNDEGLDVEQ